MNQRNRDFFLLPFVAPNGAFAFSRDGGRSCVELTQQAATWIENTQLARRIMNFSVVYAYTVKQVLRRELLYAEDLKGIISATEVRYV